MTQVNEELLWRLMLALARAHDRNVSEPETGAVLALRSGNGMATIYWRKLAIAALRSIATKDTGWQPIETAPKDGQHILACMAGTSFGHISGKQLPPLQSVVHWWGNPGEEGFYTSVNERAPERPFKATHWKPLDGPDATPSGEEE